MKFFWVDTETTGLDPVKNGIIQIAGMMYVDGKKVESFNLKCKPHPDDEIEDEALKKNNTTREEIEAYPDPSDVYYELDDMLGKHVNRFDKMDKFFAAGKNVRFDLNFLHQFFLKNGKPHPKQDCMGNPFFFSYVNSATFEVESLAMLYELKKGKKLFSSYKLQALCDAMDVPLINAHDALADIQATRNLARVLWGLIQE